MQLFSWLRKWMMDGPQTRCTPSLKPAQRFQPRLEVLEDRCLLSFSSPLSIPVPPSPSGMVAADLTGNGKSDLVVGSTSGVVVLMSQGGGTFKAPVPFRTNYAVNAVAVGDVNHDGKADIVVAENPGDGASFGLRGVVSVLLGNGKGGFGTSLDFIPDGPTDSVALADLNGDGLLDIVTDGSVLLNGNYYISVMNNSPGGVHVANDWGQAYGFSATNGMALGDLNGDGRPDIVTMGNDNAIQVWLNDGAGGFTAGQTIRWGGSYSPVPFVSDNGVALGDVNGDGKLDIVTANGANNTLSVFAGNGDGTANTTAQNYAVGGAAYGVVLGDFNKDGKLDIATSGDQMNVLLNNGPSGFGTAQAVGPGGGGSVVVGDFNGDGFPDLAQGGFSNVELLNNADGQTTGHKKP